MQNIRNPLCKISSHDKNVLEDMLSFTALTVKGDTAPVFREGTPGHVLGLEKMQILKHV